MKQKIDIETWARKDHFNFFNTFEEPYYGVCVTIDCTAAYQFAKANGVSFFLYCMYQCLTAAHAVEPFKYRIEDGEIYIYDQINAGSTVGRPNGTFGFGHFDYYPSFADFIAQANKEVERIHNTNGLERETANNLIRFSSLPWIDFTSLSHARRFSFVDSCPKISFGKMTEVDGKRSMPLSIHVHHAVVDGLHVGQYIDHLQELLNSGV